MMTILRAVAQGGAGNDGCVVDGVDDDTEDDDSERDSEDKMEAGRSMADCSQCQAVFKPNASLIRSRNDDDEEDKFSQCED
jgi:hypothetical protein